MGERFSWKGHAGRALDIVDGSAVIDCDLCRFRHVVPLPATADLSQARNSDDPTAAAERIVFFERLWPDCRKRLLAVGTRLDSLVQQGERRGWSVCGVEPAAGDGALDSDLTPKLGVFDVVHVNGLLAHVPDPRDVLRLVFALLEPRGLIAATAPRAAGALQPQRVNYFDVASMQRLLGERFELHAGLVDGGTVMVVARKPARRVMLGAGPA